MGDPRSAAPGELTRHLWMGGRRRGSGSAEPLIINRAEGIYVWDESGAQYIDAIASLEAVAIGHGRPEMLKAISAQYARIEFHDTLRYTNARAIELAARLSELAPMASSLVHFASSGSEAVEAALKILRQYHLLRGEPARRVVIARRFAYHGCTYGAMALDGNYYRTRRELFEPLGPEVRFVHPTASPEDFERAIVDADPETVAAVFIDPLATASGVYPPAPAFWRRLREICDRHGVLLVADEVITAFGRTGRWFASDQDGVAPDLITVSKALSSGYFPISAVIVDERIGNEFVDSDERVLFHGHTYGGHPVACAAALENLRLIESDGLVTASAEVGESLGRALQELTEHTFVSEVRGEGLLYGIELADPLGEFPSPESLGRAAIKSMQSHGLLSFVLHPGNVVLVCPPLVISRSQVGTLAELLGSALSDISLIKARSA